MITSDFADMDEVLEYAARLIEEQSFQDLAGILARRKRDREDAELRRKATAETRRACARHIRSFKNRPELDAKSVLRDLSELGPDDPHSMHLLDAWPLVWKGWLNINCTIRCNSIIPSMTEYRIEITERGRAVLAEAAELMGAGNAAE